MVYYCDVVSSSYESTPFGDESEALTPMCQACDRVFVNQQALTNHLENSSRHYYCRPCQRDFNSYKALQQHWKNDPRHKHTYCDRCDMNFSSCSLMLEHKRNTTSKHFLCMPCNVDYHSPTDLKQHFISSPIHDGTYCSKCERNFTNSNNLREVFSLSFCRTVSLVVDHYIASESTHAERYQLLGM